MRSAEHMRSTGQRLTYSIRYDQAQYIIARDGVVKKSVDYGMAAGVVDSEARADLMLRTAIADIDTLNGMDE